MINITIETISNNLSVKVLYLIRNTFKLHLASHVIMRQKLYCFYKCAGFLLSYCEIISTFYYLQYSEIYIYILKQYLTFISLYIK